MTLKSLVLALAMATACAVASPSLSGDKGNDTLTATGDFNRLYVCSASALPTALDLVFFRRAGRATTS
jgi:hypothetical protein